MTRPGDNFKYHTTAQEVVETFSEVVKGKYIVVTGTSLGGLGHEAARAIATQKPKLLVLASRDEEKNNEARASILKESPDVDIRCVTLDLGSQTSIRKAAAEIAALGNVNVLINNAAIMMCPYATTEDGLESQFGVNYAGPWLLTNLLLPSLLQTPIPRVVNVSSGGHVLSDIRWDDPMFSDGKTYDKNLAYGQSKTANILFAISLAEKYGKNGLVATSLHPGAVMTNLSRSLEEEDFAMWKPYLNDDFTPKEGFNVFKSIPEGAATTLTGAFDPRMSEVNGSYLANSQVAEDAVSGESIIEGMAKVQPFAKDKTTAQKLWDLTNQLLGTSFGARGFVV